MTIWTIIFPRKSETLRSVRIKEAMFAFAIGFFIATLIPATVSWVSSPYISLETCAHPRTPRRSTSPRPSPAN